MSTRLLLIRHGQSEWNAQGRWQGRADSPLSARGRAQAAAAAANLDGVEAILASPLTRALHTAEIMAEVAGLGAVEVAHGLIERDSGEWTGLTVAEIDEQWPGDRAVWRTPPGFEQDHVVFARVRAQLLDIGRRYAGREVAAVSHGGLMYVLRRNLGGVDAPIRNLGAWRIEIEGEELSLGDEVTLVTDPSPVRVGDEEQVSRTETSSRVARWRASP